DKLARRNAAVVPFARPVESVRQLLEDTVGIGQPVGRIELGIKHDDASADLTHEVGDKAQSRPQVAAVRANVPSAWPRVRVRARSANHSPTHLFPEDVELLRVFPSCVYRSRA